MKGKRKYALLVLVLLTGIVISFFMRKNRHKRKLNPPMPYVYHVFIKDTTKGKYILLAPYEIFKWRFGQLIIMDLEGNICFQRQIFGPVYCFRQWKINGKTLYSYIVDNPEAYHIDKINLATGHVVILDSALYEIKRIHLLPFQDISLTQNQDLDLHDFIMLSEEHYYTTAAYEKIVKNIPDSLHPAPKVKVVAPIIQEVDNGKVIWQWDGTRFPEFYSTSVAQNHFSNGAATHDYMHLNSLFIDGRDSNLIVSFRNTDQILKINRKSGEIIWRFGGENSDFELLPEQKFIRQHHAYLTDSNNTLLVFDNGTQKTREKSRILEFNLDEVHRKVSGFKALNIPEYYSQYMGSVEKIGDNYFICGGTSNYLLLINSTTGKKLFEIKSNQSVYRAILVDDIGELNKLKK